jgi:hypothetical protein
MAKRISARPSPTPALSRRRRPSGDRQQIDLFPDVPPISPIQMPVWQELPKEIRTSLIDLLTRLLLDHTHVSRIASPTEINHDL